MEETPHLVAHFMAAGAEKRLEDYHFLRNTYETISSQEIQLNRILRMLGEDEFTLNWRTNYLPIGRGRSRSAYEFDRYNNPVVLKGSIAYERLRDLEQESLRHVREPSMPIPSRRVHEFRERRQRFSEQREYPSTATSSITGGSSARSRALAEYDSGLAESVTKRQRQIEENRSTALRKEEKEPTERRREKFRTSFDDDNQKYGKSRQQEDESNNRLTDTTRSNGDKNKNAMRDQESNADKNRKSSIEYDRTKSEDFELSSFTVHCEPVTSAMKTSDEATSAVRLLCRWALPSSSSSIDYFTIERQLGDGDWLPIGEKINKLENQTQLEISSSKDADKEINTNVPSYFRLKGHLRNGRTVTSQPTDKIFINDLREKNVIIPDVEILSPRSVQLTWEDKKNEEQSNTYDVEKKDEQQPEWEKVIEVPVSQRSVRIDSLTDAEQCQFRLIPSLSESEEMAKTENKIESNVPTDAKRSRSRLQPSSESAQVTEMENGVESEVPSNAKRSQSRLKSSVSESSEVAEMGNDVESEILSNTKRSQSRGKTSLSESAEVTEMENEVESEVPINTKQSQSRLKSLSSESTEVSKTEKEFESKTPLDIKQSRSSSEFEETSTTENDVEPDVLTLNNVNEWLSSLHIVPTSPTTVDVDISKEGFKDYDSYKIEYTKSDQLGQWKQMSDITCDDSHLTIDDLKEGTDYKFRFTPILSSTAVGKNEPNDSHLSLILDVKMPSKRRGRFTPDENVSPTVTSPQYSNTEVFTENEPASPSVTSSKSSPQEKRDDNKRESLADVSSKRSYEAKVDDSETPVSKSSRSSISKNVDEDETRSPAAASPQFSFNKDIDEDENTTPVMASPRPSIQDDDEENESETTVSNPVKFSIQKLDATSVLIEAIVPEEEPATFEDVYDVYSKKEIADDDWTKVGTIDKEHLSTTVDDLEDNTAYAFKIDNITSPTDDDDENNTVQEFKFNTTPEKQYDTALFLEKIEESLENVVNGVMQAAAGHQIVDEPVNKSLNEVIKEIFRDEALVPSEQYGFDTLALNTDLQLYRGPKQMMLKELKVDETMDLSKHYGEIIIHNYPTSQQSVVVREENGNTRVGNIDGDIIIRNVVSDVLLKNERAHHQLSMNIVGQAFLKGVQGTLIASKFRGIIVVKNVHKP